MESLHPTPSILSVTLFLLGSERNWSTAAGLGKLCSGTGPARALWSVAPLPHPPLGCLDDSVVFHSSQQPGLM